eukprot:COSAG01_NODE_4262_length_5199_cov_16.571569_2_plen_117_part_00
MPSWQGLVNAAEVVRPELYWQHLHLYTFLGCSWYSSRQNRTNGWCLTESLRRKQEQGLGQLGMQYLLWIPKFIVGSLGRIGSLEPSTMRFGLCMQYAELFVVHFAALCVVIVGVSA